MRPEVALDCSPAGTRRQTLLCQDALHKYQDTLHNGNFSCACIFQLLDNIVLCCDGWNLACYLLDIQIDRKRHWRDMIVVTGSTIRSLHDQDNEQAVYIDRNPLYCIHAADGTR